MDRSDSTSCEKEKGDLSFLQLEQLSSEEIGQVVELFQILKKVRDRVNKSSRNKANELGNG